MASTAENGASCGARRWSDLLLSATDRSRDRHNQARDLFQQATRGGYHLALSGQIIREYLSVATRPVEVHGLGLPTRDALRNIEAFTRSPTVYCDEPEAVSVRLRELTGRYSLLGKRIHDANVVATMLVNGIERLITDNKGDFVRFADIEVCDLAEIS